MKYLLRAATAVLVAISASIVVSPITLRDGPIPPCSPGSPTNPCIITSFSR